jgi:hypothetical protein
MIAVIFEVFPIAAGSERTWTWRVTCNRAWDPLKEWRFREWK